MREGSTQQVSLGPPGEGRGSSGSSSSLPCGGGPVPDGQAQHVRKQRHAQVPAERGTWRAGLEGDPQNIRSPGA